MSAQLHCSDRSRLCISTYAAIELIAKDRIPVPVHEKVEKARTKQEEIKHRK